MSTSSTQFPNGTDLYNAITGDDQDSAPADTKKGGFRLFYQGRHRMTAEENRLARQAAKARHDGIDPARFAEYRGLHGS